ncbi:aminotransferase class I/II-fold pyridoxal phosphate-dependent enzyme [Candidatus Daviesbacteria bacterium]|nr:aminotransferase class I/II-fold pyridoxal phosphate-dependent enzyme [Candidatus Daviesbacteria bacterium]
MSKIQIAKRLNNFQEYVFSKLEKQMSDNILNFGQGNPDILPYAPYIDKFIEFIKDKKAHLYPGFTVNKEFETALIQWYKQRFAVSLEDQELYPLLGAKDGVSHLPLALLDEKDEVLVPNPGYPAFSDPALMIGARPIYYDLLQKNDFKISLKELKKKVTPKTKFIWVNFPSNPTGQVATIDELKQIVAFAKKNNLLIVYDNAYSEITFDGFIAPSILQISGAKEIAVELGSFSKTFSFAGFRMGWIVGNREIIAALAKVKSQMDSGLSTPLQRLGAFALTHFDRKWYQKMIKSYKSRRDIIAKYLNSLGLRFSLPKGALYIWAKIPQSAKNSEDYCMKLLEKKQILLTPGSFFGKNGQRFVRVSICVNIDRLL